MAVENLKSASITNLDATPVVPNATGKGAEGYLKSVADYVVPSASASTTSTYKAIRVPTNCKLMDLLFESEAQAAGKFDVGVFYSDDQRDGTSAANSGVAVDADFFATAIDCAAAVVKASIINESGTNPANKRVQPLWQALGLTSDPGGMFDIVLTCVTTAVTTGLGKIGVEARFVM